MVEIFGGSEGTLIGGSVRPFGEFGNYGELTHI